MGPGVLSHSSNTNSTLWLYDCCSYTRRLKGVKPQPLVPRPTGLTPCWCLSNLYHTWATHSCHREISCDKCEPVPGPPASSCVYKSAKVAAGHQTQASEVYADEEEEGCRGTAAVETMGIKDQSCWLRTAVRTARRPERCRRASWARKTASTTPKAQAASSLRALRQGSSKLVEK